MALADIPTGGQRRRLDSWKEIAEYLGRDVRTATRWESQGLPLHRVPGGRGTSVFAYTNEIDDWMAGRAVAPSAHTGVDIPRRPRRWIVALAAAVIAASPGVAWLVGRPGGLDAATLFATVNDQTVTLSDQAGRTRLLYRFEPGARALPKMPAVIDDLDRDGQPDILVAVSVYEDRPARRIGHGELLNLTPAGAVRWRFAFDEVLTFAGGPVSGPWALSDWQVDGSGEFDRIAIAAHDYTWWASLVTVLGPAASRLGTFVNPGWIESVLWLEPDRLAVGGFNNPRDEAMLAMLDIGRLDGQAPGSAGTPFACLSCGDAAPLFYATFPRSEVNRVTASRFNRAQVAVVGEVILVTTSETGSERGEVNAHYEFDREMRLVRASYSDRYWDEHLRLELEGRLTHSRATCPEREGPAGIHVWSGAGWRRIPAPH